MTLFYLVFIQVRYLGLWQEKKNKKTGLLGVKSQRIFPFVKNKLTIVFDCPIFEHS